MKGTSVRRFSKVVNSLIALMLLGGYATNPISYDATLPTVHEALIEFASFNDQVTGVSVSQQGRIFVNFPRWDNGMCVRYR